MNMKLCKRCSKFKMADSKASQRFAEIASRPLFFSNIECLRVCFVPVVKSSAVVLTILCFFVFTKPEQVVTVLPVYINSFCYSVRHLSSLHQSL